MDERHNAQILAFPMVGRCAPPHRVRRTRAGGAGTTTVDVGMLDRVLQALTATPVRLGQLAQTGRSSPRARRYLLREQYQLQQQLKTVSSTRVDDEPGIEIARPANEVTEVASDVRAAGAGSTGHSNWRSVRSLSLELGLRTCVIQAALSVLAAQGRAELSRRDIYFRGDLVVRGEIHGRCSEQTPPI